MNKKPAQKKSLAERIIVQTVITLFGKKFDIELSLSYHSKLEDPILFKVA
jgi:hypothetical protein